MKLTEMLEIGKKTIKVLMMSAMIYGGAMMFKSVGSHDNGDFVLGTESYLAGLAGYCAMVIFDRKEPQDYDRRFP